MLHFFRDNIMPGNMPMFQSSQMSWVMVISMLSIIYQDKRITL